MHWANPERRLAHRVLQRGTKSLEKRLLHGERLPLHFDKGCYSSPQLYGFTASFAMVPGWV
jgi:hypothetical protein